MTMRFVPNTAYTATDSALKIVYLWLDFMRTASPGGPGWTIPRSSDGTVGGAGDNISGYLDLGNYVAGVSESWFVIRQPDGAREILYARASVSDSQWHIFVSETAAFTGGSIAARPTAVDEKEVMPVTNLVQAGQGVLHMGADDAAPYGWWFWTNASGSFTNGNGTHAMIPITHAIQPGDVGTNPCVFFCDPQQDGLIEANLYSGNQTGVYSRLSCFEPGSTNYQCVAGLIQRCLAGSNFPNYCSQDGAGKDIAIPITISRRSSYGSPFFKGITDFIMWNGVDRNEGETWEGLTRISIGDVNVEWDGLTVPLAS